MDTEKMKRTLLTPEYDFLRQNMHLGGNIILLGPGGSHAYGMAREDSDLDIRGNAVNTKREILLGEDFEQVVESETDTVIYSLRKMVGLLLRCNPNTIEILGLEQDKYLSLSETGRELLQMKKAFLSKLCIHSFSGYAHGQLRRMENKTARQIGQAQQEKHILNKLGKHMAHLLRLYLMCIDILTKEEIITCRTKEHDLLMRIRNGDYLDDMFRPSPDFYDILNEYEKKMEDAVRNTSLPELPDYEAVYAFLERVNEKIVKESL